MSKDRASIGTAPEFFPADPLARQFPSEWKSIYFRRQALRGQDGVARYRCPLCNGLFDHSDIDSLAGDHIWPYSLCGETSWQNYQLLCSSCNGRKSNFVGIDLRKVLGEGAFRELVTKFLREQVENKRLPLSVFLDQILNGG
jgi:hypothetical protein